MSRQKQKILQQAKLSDRRFGKGIVCRLFSGSLIIDILNRYSILPPGTLLNVQADGIPVSIAIERALYFAIPISLLDKLEDELKNYTPQTPASIIGFLKQNLVMIRIPPERCPNGNGIINPQLFDILIETIDVSETLDGVFVQRPQFNFERKKTVDKDG